MQSGELEVIIEGDWSIRQAGKTGTVPPGTVPTFRSSGPVELINVHSPALRYEEMFRQFHALKIEEGFSQQPDSFREIVLMAMGGPSSYRSRSRTVRLHSCSNCLRRSIGCSGTGFQNTEADGHVGSSPHSPEGVGVFYGGASPLTASRPYRDSNGRSLLSQPRGFVGSV